MRLGVVVAVALGLSCGGAATPSTTTRGNGGSASGDPAAGAEARPVRIDAVPPPEPSDARACLAEDLNCDGTVTMEEMTQYAERTERRN